MTSGGKGSKTTDNILLAAAKYIDEVPVTFFGMPESVDENFDVLWKLIEPVVGAMMSEEDFHCFISRCLPKKYQYREFTSDERTRTLGPILGEKLRSGLIQDIGNLTADLPFKYVTQVRLKSVKPFAIALTKAMWITPESVSMLKPEVPVNDIVYLRLFTHGYAGGYFGFEQRHVPVNVATSRIKRFVSLGCAMQAFSINWSHPNVAVPDVGSVAEFLDEVLSSKATLPLHPDWLRFLSGLEIMTENIGPKEADALRLIAAACEEADRDFSHVAAAAEWAFESMAASDERHDLLLTSIALEALLGEAEKADRESSVTNQLADRLSYLIGWSRTSRRSLSRHFKKFYKLRSDIVHGNQQKIADADLHYLPFGHGMMTLAIEIELESYLRSVGVTAPRLTETISKRRASVLSGLPT